MPLLIYHAHVTSYTKGSTPLNVTQFCSSETLPCAISEMLQTLKVHLSFSFLCSQFSLPASNALWELMRVQCISREENWLPINVIIVEDKPWISGSACSGLHLV